jgi:hypothetical protein
MPNRERALTVQLERRIPPEQEEHNEQIVKDLAHAIHKRAGDEIARNLNANLGDKANNIKWSVQFGAIGTLRPCCNFSTNYR